MDYNRELRTTNYELRKEGLAMSGDPDLRNRTQQLSLRIIHLVESLPASDVGRVIGHQVLRCGTSVGANYRAAKRAKSRADMLNKLKIVEEEADETLYWLELLVKAGIIPAAKLEPLMKEVEEILAMTVSSIKTLRAADSR
jgi:four helix bundle protein